MPDQLWDDLKQQGEQAIENLCSSQTPESQQLEFKSKARPSSAELDKDDRQNLGKTLSAFSNASGGVLIFGIEPARKGDESWAGRPAPITPLNVFADRVHGLVGQLLTPPNPNVELLAIPCANAANSGFLAIRVGASDLRPHMSMAPDHQRYFLRAGSITMPMVDFQVRDMLRIRTSPDLVLSVEFRVAGDTAVDKTNIVLVLTIGNRGRVSAHYPYLSVSQDRDAAWVEAAPFSKRVAARRVFFEAPALSIHPGQDIAAARLTLQASKRDGGEARFNYRNYGDDQKCMDTDLRVECEIGCQDMPARRFVVLMPANKFEHAVDRIGARRPIEVDAGDVTLLPTDFRTA